MRGGFAILKHMREFFRKVGRLFRRRPQGFDYTLDESLQYSRDAVQKRIHEAVDAALASESPVEYMTGVILAPGKDKNYNVAKMPGQLRLWIMTITARIKTEEISPTLSPEKLVHMQEIRTMLQEQLDRSTRTDT